MIGPIGQCVYLSIPFIACEKAYWTSLVVVETTLVRSLLAGCMQYRASLSTPLVPMAILAAVFAAGLLLAEPLHRNHHASALNSVSHKSKVPEEVYGTSMPYALLASMGACDLVRPASPAHGFCILVRPAVMSTEVVAMNCLPPAVPMCLAKPAEALRLQTYR